MLAGEMSLLALDSEIGLHLKKRRLLAVVTLHDADHAEPMAEALLRGGIDAIELTLRTPAALDSIRRIREAQPDMRLGAGTVLTNRQVDEVLEAGADFAVSPSVNPRLIRHATEAGLPFSPGVMTPTDIDVALDAGCHLLKFFPAGPAGGLAYLNAMAAPFSHLGIGFIPLGGVTTENLLDWLNHPYVVAVGGSWLAPPDDVAAGRWDLLESKARHAVAIASSGR